MYWDGSVETTKEAVRTILAEEFTRQHVHKVLCNVHDDFENVERNPVFYIVLYSVDDYFDLSRVQSCMCCDEKESYGVFRITAISILDREELNDFQCIWEEGGWLDANQGGSDTRVVRQSNAGVKANLSGLQCF